MTESDFYNDDFEELIRQKTDQYKMYPSENVWKGVYGALHTRRRRFIAGMTLLVTGILFIAAHELLGPDTQPAQGKIPTDIIALLHADDTIASSPFLSDVGIHTVTRQTSPVQYADKSIYEDTDATSAFVPSGTVTVAVEKPIPPTENTAAIIESIPAQERDIARATILPSTLSIDESIKTISPEAMVSTENAEDKKDLNWLQQTATYEIKNPVKRGKMNWQAYFSPTVSYRTLSGGDAYPVQKTGLQYVPIATTHFGSPNDFVNHKPALGFEAGGGMLYRLTRNLTIKTGLQFNYTRYSIKAYTSSNSQQATIALNSYGGYGFNTITAYSNLQNFGGNAQTDLYNHYYQLSVPVGFELRVLGNERLQFNIGANIQPTYLINRNAYVLTTDYSDYTKAPSLFRRWNYNGAVEAFISYKIGGFRWQVGPELRYQLLSTYTDQYPIKENLKQYGLKIGVSKTIW